MSIWFFIFAVVAIAIICGVIYGLKWILENCYFSDNPKADKVLRIVFKALRMVFYGLLVYIIFTSVLIIFEPLFNRLGIAFSSAVSAFLAFLDKLIPYAVVSGIGYFWWREKHPKAPLVGDRVIAADDVEKAEQEAQDLHGDMGELAYNASVDVAKVKQDLIVCPDDLFGMETGRDKPYRMDEDMAIHQFILDTPTSPLTKDMENSIMQELQRHINQRSKRYPHLCRSGYAPIVYDVRDAGGFVTVEIVLYAEKYIDKVKARHSTHFGRQLDYKPVASADDPLFKK